VHSGLTFSFIALRSGTVLKLIPLGTELGVVVVIIIIIIIIIIILCLRLCYVFCANTFLRFLNSNHHAHE
jgi:hypothetical protein